MQKIAIDIDEVLMPFVKPMAKWRGLKMPASNQRYEYVYKTMFNITESESSKMVEEFYQSEDFYKIQPIVRSQIGMVKLKSKYKKIYAVTGRQDAARTKTEAWLNRHFEGIFDDLVMTNSYTDLEISKVDICRSLAIKTIIDDNIHICRECKKDGMKAYNFMGYEEVYPWCEQSDMSMYGWK
jgi:hypothetical protein